jgi:putative hydrolase of the HAD superfamily
MPTKKFIFFDAAGTLFDIERGVGFHYNRLAQKHGVVSPSERQIAPETLDHRFNDFFKKAPPLAFSESNSEALRQAERQWWRNLVRQVFEGTSFPSFDSFFDELYHFFQEGSAPGEGSKKRSEEAAWILFYETVEVLEHLSQSGFQLGVISNFDSRLHSVLKSLHIAHFFKTVTISGEEGFAKPSPEIFIKALQKAGAMPNESLFIGDHPINDIEGATDAGIDAVLVDRRQEYRLKNKIEDLRGIYAYL